MNLNKNKLNNLFSDIAVMTKRYMTHYTRLPQLLVFSTIQPIMFVVLFVYVFGGAIQTPGINYVNFLLPGIIVQTVLFGAMNTGIGLADDISKGMIDRFRSMPISQSAVLAGRTLSDILRNAFVVILMVVVGLIMGFRPDNGFFNFMGAMGLAVLFGFAFSWISATIGLAVKSIETAQVAGFIWVFPLAFISSIFVPITTMPAFFEWFAKVSPVTATVDTVRALSVGGPAYTSMWHALLWILFILAVFIPLAVRQYRKIQ